MAIVVLPCLIGIFLGLTFRVLIVPPAVMACATVYGMISGSDGPGQTILGIVFLTIALQVGYLIGLIGREPVGLLKTRLSLATFKRT
jgi:hypothetical protein